MPALWTLALHERRGAARGRMHVLVSRHQDGRLIGSIMQAFGVDIVYGSSARRQKDKGGVASLRALMTVLRQGDQIVITPDGPRGPPRKAAAGVAQLAALTQAPIVPCSAQISRRRVLGTWDKMVLPLPFGRGVIVCSQPIIVEREAWTARLPEIEAAMTRAAEEADARCGA